MPHVIEGSMYLYTPEEVRAVIRETGSFFDCPAADMDYLFKLLEETPLLKPYYKPKDRQTLLANGTKVDWVEGIEFYGAPVLSVPWEDPSHHEDYYWTYRQTGRRKVLKGPIRMLTAKSVPQPVWLAAALKKRVTSTFPKGEVE